MPGKQTIGLIGAGAMGGGFGRRFVANGFAVLSPLDGRSAATQARARTAGIRPAAYADLVETGIVLSVVPPAEAMEVARQFAAVATGSGAAPLFVDGNALSPDTKQQMADMLARSGLAMADGVIIGGPMRDGEAGPRLYVSGVDGAALEPLRLAGLDVRMLDGPIGAAAALKMCYAGLNKGVIGLTTAALLAARRAGAEQALIAEMAISQRYLLERGRDRVPDMYPKAYRWIAEFEEIAHFNRDDATLSAMFAAYARFFADRAAAQVDGREPAEIDALLNG